MNKRKIYESIMRNVSKEVKKALNEGECGYISRNAIKEIINSIKLNDGSIEYDGDFASQDDIYDAQQSGIMDSNIENIISNAAYDLGIEFDDASELAEKVIAYL